MTGFARCQTHDECHSWSWELKSVNHRVLDVRCRLPHGLDALEPVLRRLVAERIERGSVTVVLTMRRTAGAAPVRLNRSLFDAVLGIAHEVESDRRLAPPRIDGLLALPGMIEAVEDDEAALEVRQAAVLASFRDGLALLAGARADEGARIGAVLEALLAEIAALADEAAASAAAQPAALRERLEAQISELLDARPALPEERLAQEVAVLAAKADVREEIDRLCAHVDAGSALLAEGGAIGRRLDFLCQELNREANTLCAKANDIALTRTGLALKAVIDRLREQAQNVE
jgi:uncharacterized protein (TIGR00255 family)